MTVNNPFEAILKELAELRAEVRKIKLPEVEANPPNDLTRDQAIDHLRDIGLPIEKSQFYKLTANGTIPSQRIGKRLILSRAELDAWVESQKYRRVSPEQKAAKSLAISATKKMERANL
jgi:excisionase family DNA binding protein